MRINRVVARDFLSYDELDLDLSGLSTAAIVGMVGAGKSALIEAITWGLWGKANRAVVIRDDTDETTVQIEFTARGDECVVIRTMHASGRDSSLSFIVNGVNQAQHIKTETQAAIDKKIGLDYDSIIAGPLMIQLHSSHLMELKPSDRKDLLIRLFGVDKYEAYHKEASTRASGYAREADSIDAEVADLNTIVAGLGEAQATLANAKYDLATAMQERADAQTLLATAQEQQISLREKQRHADTLRQTVSSLGQRIESDQKEHTRLLRAISDAHQAVSIPAPVFDPLPDVSEEAIQVSKVKWDSLAVAHNERIRIEAQLPGQQAAYERSQKLAAIVSTVPCGGEGIYATCRFLTSAPKAGEIETLARELEEMTARLASLPTQDAVTAARHDHESISDQHHAVQRQSLQQDAAQQQWELKVASARQTVSTGQDSLKRLESQIARDQSILARSGKQLAEVQSDSTQVDALDVQIRSLKEQTDEQTSSIEIVYQPAVSRAEDRLAAIEVARTKVEPLAKTIKELRGKAEVYATLAKAFHRDGIPTLILENGIPVIEEHANEILDRMPDKYRLRILTQREKKKGGMADRVDVVVERAGGKPRNYSNLSGGQKFRVDFALRVSLGRVLAHRAGASIDTLILDEGWGTQDKRGIEALLESLAAVQDQFGLVLIITHQEAVIERFETRIEVELSEDGISSIKIVD